MRKDAPSPDVVRLRLPGTLASRERALEAVSRACRAASADHDETFEYQTVSAFGEAFNNIVLHSYRLGPPSDIDIEIESTAERLRIRLLDTGSGFDPPAAAPVPPALSESGMGLYILRSWVVLSPLNHRRRSHIE